MRKIISIICLLLLVSTLLPQISRASLVNDLKVQIEQKEQEIKQLEAQAAAYKKELETTQSAKNTLNNQLATIASRIKKLQNDIYITSARISSTTLKIEELSLDIDEKQDEIDKKKKEISDVIQVLAEYDNESLMEIVLTKASFSDFLNQVRYLESLQESIQENLTALQSIKKDMESQKTTTVQQKNQLAALQGQLSGQKQVVDKEKEEKNYLLVQTKGQEKQYQTLLNDTLRKQQEVEQQIFDLEDKIKLTLDPNSMPEARSGVLSWPLDGVLTQSYGYTAYSKKLYTSGFHNGIDIASSYGEAIRAARDGKVLAIGNCGSYAYGKWIMIEHDNKLTTLYGHMSGYGGFKAGDSVKRGDIIGYEGSTGYSTGPHLHFGVYASETVEIQKVWYGTVPIGAHLDPQKYL
ncbi:peptidoglycan DD-metalloendopeptidase family protein [Patescibacteria group bacterium]|nr:peptidoglycan DD-metalloendopeptidase family protein [Patescibacteria group bacterium]MBU4458743.1 peptidoglycan DD-metalloendopeptidase family protein [Patescibacteria group bacterium]